MRGKQRQSWREETRDPSTSWIFIPRSHPSLLCPLPPLPFCNFQAVTFTFVTKKSVSLRASFPDETQNTRKCNINLQKLQGAPCMRHHVGGGRTRRAGVGARGFHRARRRRCSRGRAHARDRSCSPPTSAVTDPAHRCPSEPHLPINSGPSEPLFSNCSLGDKLPVGAPTFKWPPSPRTKGRFRAPCGTHSAAICSGRLDGGKRAFHCSQQFRCPECR